MSVSAARSRFETSNAPTSSLLGAPLSPRGSKDKEKEDKKAQKDKEDKKEAAASSPLSAKPPLAATPAGGASNASSRTSSVAVARGAATTSVDEEVEAAYKAAIDNGEWKVKQDPKSGKDYFYNKTTKVTTWDLKKDLRKDVEAKRAASSSTAATAAPPPAAREQPAPSVQPTVNSGMADNATAGKATAAQSATTASTAAAAPTATAIPQPTPRQPTSTTAAAAAGAPSPSSATPAYFPDLRVPTYVDPVEKLLAHNSSLQQMIAGGGRGSVALDFQQRYEALERTNAALSVQLERLRVEHQSMAAALTEANKTIHEQQARLARCQPAADRTKDEELQLTMAHLREQNRVLVQQIGELHTLLARGLCDAAARVADSGVVPASGAAFGAAAGGVGGATAVAESGAQLLTKFLDSSARHALCPSCVLNVTKHRDKLLPPVESNVGRVPSVGRPGGADPSSAVPAYRPVPELTQPPPTQYYSENSGAGPSSYGVPHSSVGRSASGGANNNSGFAYGLPPSQSQQQQFGTGGASSSAMPVGHASSSPWASGQRGGADPAASAGGVMYGGFVVRNTHRA